MAADHGSQQLVHDRLAFHPVTTDHLATKLRLTTTLVSGLIFFVIAPDSRPEASAEQIAAGLDSTGLKGEWSATHIVTTVDSFLLGPGRLRAGSAYKIAAVHQDRDGNFSEIVSLVFKTPAESER